MKRGPANPETAAPASGRVGPTSSAGTGPRHALNPLLAGFSCIRCGADYPPGDYFEGCPRCLAEGEPSSVRPVHRARPQSLGDQQRSGMQRYAGWMPYESWVSLGEGRTPCIGFPTLAAEVRTAAVVIKNEGQNPSGSHKDRASCLTVTRALDVGATSIIAASSGNGGASLALYAAAAGLRCAIVTTPALSPVHRRAIAMTGAEIITAPESLERWSIVAERVKAGWFPATNYLNPPVGSNAFGLPGLMTVAFELFEELGDNALDALLVPTSRGDLIWGVHEGFRLLREAGLAASVPRLFAVEPFARIRRVLDGEPITGSFPGSTSLVSIGGSTVTYQAVEAVQASGGGAVVVDDGIVARDQARLARHGCYAELSSAATLTGLEQLLRQGTLHAGDRVGLIVTSNGYKELPA
jgi:threonine synthase